MVEREDYEKRMKRLRQATEDLELPVGFTSRVMARVDRRSSEASFWEAIGIVGPWAIVPAACASAGVTLLASLHSQWFDDAILLATSVGWVP